jgi:hypothetical protein
MFGREIYVDQDYNQWTQFSGDWFVLMSNQFNQNNPRKKFKTILWEGHHGGLSKARNWNLERWQNGYTRVFDPEAVLDEELEDDEDDESESDD